MKTLLKSAKIISPGSKHHGKVRDILLEKGKIIRIAANIDDSDAKIVQQQGMHVSPGWKDLRVNFREPGEEYKEGIHSGLDAAAHGGFTGVLLMPSTTPVIDSKSIVEFVQSQARGHIVKLDVAAAISKGMKGEGLSEMFDLYDAGALVFTDDKSPVNHTELMHRALEYSKNFNGLVMSFAFDNGISPGGLMHEGKMSTLLGMRGIPEIAETICLQRDLDLLRYTGGRMHVSLISTAEGVELIRKAKKEGLNITADVSAAHLLYTDEELQHFDSNFKTLPPFRSNHHRKALLKGLKDGSIDAICSDHAPHDIEAKQKEFENAEFGIAGIEGSFSAALMSIGHDDEALSLIVEKMSLGPSVIMGYNPGIIEEGADADLTIFNTELEWVFDQKNIRSRSVYSPYKGKTLKGKAIGVIRNRLIKLF